MNWIARRGRCEEACQWKNFSLNKAPSAWILKVLYLLQVEDAE